MINSNWSRWIVASLSVHFDNERQSIPFYVEGQIRPATIYDFAELRMDGPFFHEVNQDYWYVDVNPAILIQIIQSNETHKLERYIGIFSAAFTKSICVYRYGDGPNDDGNQFGVLVMQPDSPVRVDKFGQVQSATRIAQAAIETRYRMRLLV